ncbi:unnamed protein product [Owenia fusiformis]|uniref:Uncharacterized protein n=1 Tax=Owenia fusiformis TaxID=6347 RepID=A0A8J1TFN4_OWEFU|nr:unnamed protein product [Owenia fusiformis]
MAAQNHTLDAAIDLAGGTAGAFASVYVGQSLDTVKVKMQTFPKLYKNGLDCFLKTYRQEGIYRGLYAGTIPALTANIAENSTLFMFYGLCQKGIMSLSGKKSTQDLGSFENALSGSGAAIFCSFTLCPTELVKCRLQAMREMSLQEGKAKIEIGPFGLTRQILRAEGVRGLYHGLTSTIAREVPGYFFFFGGYETCRYLLTPVGKTKEDIGALRTILSGGIGGICFWLSIFPTDVVKSRHQVESQHGHKLDSFFTTLMKVYRETGFKSLYKGLGPTLIRTFPATGALFFAYELAKKSLHELANGKSDSQLD